MAAPELWAAQATAICVPAIVAALVLWMARMLGAPAWLLTTIIIVAAMIAVVGFIVAIFRWWTTEWRERRAE